jgi:hypothetical protein
MAGRNAIFQVKQIEKLALIPRLPAHHRQTPSSKRKTTESRFANNHDAFFNTIDPFRTLSE